MNFNASTQQSVSPFYGPHFDQFGTRIGSHKSSILPYFFCFLQHETNCESTTNHLRTPFIKEEPDFVETHCSWRGCDRDLHTLATVEHTQEQLVKVRRITLLPLRRRFFISFTTGCFYVFIALEQRPYW